MALLAIHAEYIQPLLERGNLVDETDSSRNFAHSGKSINLTFPNCVKNFENSVVLDLAGIDLLGKKDCSSYPSNAPRPPSLPQRTLENFRCTMRCQL